MRAAVNIIFSEITTPCLEPAFTHYAENVNLSEGSRPSANR